MTSARREWLVGDVGLGLAFGVEHYSCIANNCLRFYLPVIHERHQCRSVAKLWLRWEMPADRMVAPHI
jgi:hypothetical protein